VERMRRLAQDIAEGVTDDTLRARWLEWTSALADHLLAMDQRLRDVRALIVQIGDRTTAAVADAMTEYAAAEELRRAADHEELTALMRRERDAMIRDIAAQIRALDDRVGKLAAHMDDLHLEILSALMALQKGKRTDGA